MTDTAIAEAIEETVPVDGQIEVGDANGRPSAVPEIAELSDVRRFVGDYRVHKAAEVFPALEGTAFEELVNEIEVHGQREAVIVQGDCIIEGVDIVRAVGVLKKRGVDIELQTLSWQPRPGNTVAGFLLRKLHLGPRYKDAQRAQIAADLLEQIEEERAAAQECSRIKPGEVRNPRGINSREKQGDGGNESCPPADAKARNKIKVERSTIGRIAKEADVSTYAAGLAVKIKRHASADMIAAVKAGTKEPKEVIATFEEPARKKTAAAKTPKPIEHPFTPETELQHDLLKAWVRLCGNKVAVSERAQARADMRAIFKAEESAERDAKKHASASNKEAAK